VIDGDDRRTLHARQVEREDASTIGKGACVDPAVVRVGAPSAERETQAQTASIGPTLLERAEQLIDLSSDEAAAFILNLDEHTLGACPNPERHGGTRACELQRVLHEVCHHCPEHLAVSLNRDTAVNRQHGQR